MRNEKREGREGGMNESVKEEMVRMKEKGRKEGSQVNFAGNERAKRHK